MEVKYRVHRVLIDVRESDVLVGIRLHDGDPMQTIVQGDLEDALVAIPALVKAAEDHLVAHPRNPKKSKPSAPAPAPVEQEMQPSTLPLFQVETPETPETPVEAVEQPSKTGKYQLQDGRGPYDTIQGALDALGIPKDNRPTHNRYSRLSKGLQAAILEI